LTGRSPSVDVEPTACAVCGASASTPVASGRDYEYHSSPDTFTFVRCDSCAHVFLNPRPTARMAHVIYPPNYYTVSGAHHSAVLSVLGRIKDRVLVRRLAQVLPRLPASGQVLEIGAGDGSLLLALRKARPDARLLALDLRFAPERAKALEAQGIECIEGLLEDSSLPSGCDLVIMNQLIEHLWELDSGLRKISAAVRTGGAVSISTPNLRGYDRSWFSRTAWGGYHFPRHLNLFTPESLGQLLGRYGFRAVSHANLAAPLIWLATAQNLAGRYGVRARWFLTESNLPLLAAFTTLDMILSKLGCSTSNQQVVAVREGARPA
jgi:SAM-dependent methyltransferase